MNIERRTVTLTECEIRAEGDGRKFIGYASVFDNPYRVGTFRETVNPAAFNRALAARQDVKLLWNHDSSAPLGRSGVNMSLSVDQRGLRVEADLPNTSLGNDMAELVRSGIINQMSFGFSVPKGGDSWSRGADGMAERSLNDVDLYDVSPVTYPAAPDTTAEVRAYAVEVEKRDPQDVVNTPVDQDVVASVIGNIAALAGQLSSMLGLGDDMEGNDAEADAEYRMAYTQAERDEMAKNGEALPDGSFPIKNATDLANAIRTVGLSKHANSTVIAHIKKRATALGLTASLPDSWNAGDEAPETRQGMVLSAENHAHISSAMAHLEQVMQNATTPATQEQPVASAPVDLLGYNSLKREAAIRKLRIASL